MSKCNWCGNYYEDKGNFLGDKETFIEQGFCCNKCMYDASHGEVNNNEMKEYLDGAKKKKKYKFAGFLNVLALIIGFILFFVINENTQSTFLSIVVALLFYIPSIIIIHNKFEK